MRLTICSGGFMDKYEEIKQWQKAKKLFIGDEVSFNLKGKKRTGFLTGFDLLANPIKPIIRYLNRKGQLRLVCLDNNYPLIQSNK